MAEERDMPALGAYADRLMKRREERHSRSWKRKAAQQFDPPSPDGFGGASELAKRAIGDDFGWADKACAAAIEVIGDLTDFEGDFVSQLAGRLGRYGKKTMVSARQLDKLREIAGKAGVDVDALALGSKE